MLKTAPSRKSSLLLPQPCSSSCGREFCSGMRNQSPGWHRNSVPHGGITGCMFLLGPLRSGGEKRADGG